MIPIAEILLVSLYHDGTAILLTFESLKGMNNYIKILAMHLNADKFELTPNRNQMEVSQ